MNEYNPKKIERKWQKVWEGNNSFVSELDKEKKKFYVLEMFPYPSGNIHMGHLRNYTIGDVIARFYKANKYNVLHPMGWDSFGMPAENAAIENKTNPKSWTEENIKNMRQQLKSIGLSIDWNREISTCSKEYYKHQQKIFIDLYKKNLIYKKDSYVNWDPVDNTVLANEQVIDGKGWRSGAIIEKRMLSQWFLKITAFAEELLEDLDDLNNWPSKVKLMQKNWIGLSNGVEIKFKVKDIDKNISVFTTRPETLFGAAFLGLSVEHPLSERLENLQEFKNFKNRCLRATNKNIDEEKIGFFSGLVAEHPLSKFTITLTLSPSTKLFTKNVFDADAGFLSVGPTKNVYVADAIFVASKTNSSPSQNVSLVAFDVKFIPTTPIEFTVIEFVVD